MGDQQAALYGQGCFASGSIKNTYGTGCFMLLNTGNTCVYSPKGLLTTLGCDAHGQPVYVLEGAVFIAGAVIQWLRDELKMIKDSSSTEKTIAGIKDTHGVYLVPAFVGLGDHNRFDPWDKHRAHRACRVGIHGVSDQGSF
jgi:glycerol kinase